MDMRYDTVKVINEADPSGGYKIINKHDFDEKLHVLHEANEKPDANAAPGGIAAPRNTSGTFQEPTPTDIRYKDKDGTEFENNHGAFLGGSAAELREAADLEDAPGGIVPEQHEKIADATEKMREVAEEPVKHGSLAQKLAKRGGGLRRK